MRDITASLHATPPALVTKTPVLDAGNGEAKREEIRQYFHDTFTLYESLFECLSCDDAYYARANPLRHPLIFYYGHTSVFFINKLNATGIINKRVSPKLESMLAVGVDEMSWDDLNEKSYDWPTPREVKQHRDRAREVVDKVIRECDCTLPITWDDPLWVIMMGIEHERIHLETSAVLMRELPLHLVRDHDIWGNICRERGTIAVKNEMLPVEGGTITLGKSKSNALYGWDNEYGTNKQTVQPFRASKYLVSNGEFKKFVDAGGYAQERFWTAEGWKWVCYRKAKFPTYWTMREGVEGEPKFALRTMLTEIDMPWDWPAEVNYLESKAFCNWMSEERGVDIRLPTEAEWYQLRTRVDTDQPYWNKAPGNVNLEGDMSPCPVTRHAFPGGFHDVLGNVWQWTETAIDGFDGFDVHPAYDDFSVPTFDGQHNVFKGGCWISTGNYAIRDSRYAFRRHFLQHSGLRYVEGVRLSVEVADKYETDSIVACYIESHYGKQYLGVEPFQVRCAEEVGNAARALGVNTGRALDIGCAAGRASFELAKIFDEVDGVDFSTRLIETPIRLQTAGVRRYSVQEEGELSTFKEVRLRDFPYGEVAHKARFSQGDACNLAAKFDGYDVIFAGNLLDRLYDPAGFLATAKERIVSGGLLVLASPYTWLEEYTPRDKWLGGFKANTGESFTTLDGIREALAPEFEMVREPVDVPFVLRETRRKFQYVFSQLTVWRKVA